MLQQDISSELIRFVKQSDNVSNAIWYLRKIEWEWSLRCIGKPPKPNSRILDIASEVRISSSLYQKGWLVSRVDFSQESALEAQRRGPKFSGHVVVDPLQPEMPFSNKSFEASISIGPFDFKFLHITALLTQVKRVLKNGGKFVFSLPTLKSPYCNPNSRQKFRYWSSKDISDIIRKWPTGDVERINIPQPRWVYSRLGYTHRIPRFFFDVLFTKPILFLCPFLPNWFGSYIILSFNKKFYP